MNIIIKVLIIGIAIALLLLLLFRLMGYMIMFFNFKRKIRLSDEARDFSFAGENNIFFEEDFIGFEGDRRKCYMFRQREEKSSKLVILSKGHGIFTPDYKNIILSLVQAGYDVFSFDVKGHGESDGSCPEGYQQWIIDLEMAIKEKRDEYSNIYILSHSIGAFAALTYLINKDETIKKVASVAPINTSLAYAGMVYEMFPCIFTKQLVIAVENYEKRRFKKYVGATAVEGINSVDIPILILQGDRDQWVPIDRCSLVKYKDKITNKNATVKVITGADHFLLSDDDNIKCVLEFLKDTTNVV